MTAQVHCPVCGAPVAWHPASTWRPFCSERCKLIDLGDWAAERHVIAGQDSEPGRLHPPAGHA
jgi:endogenous inhibitor of DNA gyrase (YacG/DUF329 family)